MKSLPIFVLFLLAAFAANADSEIYKCVDADGNIAYQQTPCPVVKEEAEVVEIVEVAEVTEVAEEEAPQALVANDQSHEEIETCKDPLRAAIDEIEAEMLRGFSPEEGEAFKVELRTLTQEMRACG